MNDVRKYLPFALQALYLGVVGVCAYYFTHLRFALSDTGWMSLTDLVNGTAPTPFQYRALMPWLVKGLLSLPPLQGVSVADAFRFSEFAAAAALALAFRWYLSAFFHNKTLAAILSLSVFYALPFHFIFPRRLPLYYPYDISAIVFFTLGLIGLHRRNWRAYYPVFLIATINRETACFLILVYAATASGHTPRRTLALHLLAQTALWVAVKAGLYWLYRGNPGLGLFEIQFQSNLKLLTEPLTLTVVSGMWGYTWLPALLFFRLISDRFVRRSLIVVIPALFGLGLVGVVFEMRLYAEFIPLVLAAFWLIVQRLAQGEERPSVLQETSAPPEAVTATHVDAPLRLNLLGAAWIGLSALWLAFGLGVIYLWTEQRANVPIEAARAFIQDGAQDVLAAAKPNERIVVVNWPENVRVNQPARLLGLLPFTPPALRVTWPEESAPNATLLQYIPWQKQGNNVRVYYTGRIVTESELVEQMRQADRVMDFHAEATQVYSLAERWPPGPAPTCRVKFGAGGGVCLVEAVLIQQGAELRLDLTWQVAQRPGPQTTVFVHVFDASGALAAQADGDPAYNTLPLAAWPGPEYILRETRWAARPEAEYQVHVGLYNRGTGERLEAACTPLDVCSVDGLVLRTTVALP